VYNHGNKPLEPIASSDLLNIIQRSRIYGTRTSIVTVKISFAKESAEQLKRYACVMTTFQFTKTL